MAGKQQVRSGPTTRPTGSDGFDDAGAAGVHPAVVARAAAGDEDAWRELVALYARRLYALAASRLRDRAAAEEVVQGMFATAAVKLRDGGYAEQGRFEAWLFRIAGNRVRDEIRRRKRSPSVEPLDAGRVASEGDRSDGPDTTSLARLRRAMGELNEQDREIIELRHHGGMGFKQMAELLEEPVGTLLARHHRALRKLRAILESTASGDDASGADA